MFVVVVCCILVSMLLFVVSLFVVVIFSDLVCTSLFAIVVCFDLVCTSLVCYCYLMYPYCCLLYPCLLLLFAIFVWCYTWWTVLAKMLFVQWLDNRINRCNFLNILKHDFLDKISFYRHLCGSVIISFYLVISVWECNYLMYTVKAMCVQFVMHWYMYIQFFQVRIQFFDWVNAPCQFHDTCGLLVLP